MYWKPALLAVCISAATANCRAQPPDSAIQLPADLALEPLHVGFSSTQQPAGLPDCLSPAAEPVAGRGKELARLLENLSLFGGLEGAKGPDDLGINANFGLRGHLNWGYPIWE